MDFKVVKFPKQKWLCTKCTINDGNKSTLTWRCTIAWRFSSLGRFSLPLVAFGILICISYFVILSLSSNNRTSERQRDLSSAAQFFWLWVCLSLLRFFLLSNALHDFVVRRLRERILFFSIEHSSAINFFFLLLFLFNVVFLFYNSLNK